MPSIESNTIYRCKGCRTIYDFEGSTPFIKPCERCGVLSYEQLVVQVVCDFCSRAQEEGEVFWTYPCANFIYPVSPPTDVPSGGSMGGWAACDACHELIEALDLDTLARRSVDADLHRHPHMNDRRQELLSATTRMQLAFMRHRIGEPRKENLDEPQ